MAPAPARRRLGTPPVPRISATTELRDRPASSRIATPILQASADSTRPRHAPVIRPCTAVSISTASPSASAVAAHALRGTTSPLRATATRRSSVRARDQPVHGHAVVTLDAIAVDGRPLMRDPPRRGANGAAYGSGSSPPVNQVGDRVRGDRREQHAVAVVAGGHHQAGQRRRAEQRRVVGGARAATGPASRPVPARRPRAPPRWRAEQVEHRAGGDRRVDPRSSWVAPTTSAVLARHQIDVPAPAPAPGRCREQAGVAAQPQDLALDRPHRQRRSAPGRVPLQRARAPARPVPARQLTRRRPAARRSAHPS